MSQVLKIYLAGPEVFLPHAIEIGQRKKALCRQYGFEGLFPFDNEVVAGPDERADRLIYAANLRMMRAADLGVFNLTPFRGPHADVGTVFELGMMTGWGRPVFGYTNTTATMLERTPGATRDPATGVWCDRDGLTVEDFGNADNLMIDAALAGARNMLVRFAGDGRLDELGGFEDCLRTAAERFDGVPADKSAASLHTDRLDHPRDQPDGGR